MREAIINDLFNEACSLPYAGSGMMQVPAMKGKGFFPGCTGLSTGFTSEDTKPVMILGQDFGTQAYYSSVEETDGELSTSTTFRQLTVLLDELGIKSEDCFFTNIFPGLRESGKMTGPCQPALNPESPFAEACNDFLTKQIEAVNPNLVIVLGTSPAKTLATWNLESFPAWKNLAGITKPISANRFYDYAGNLFHDVRYGSTDVRFLFALHPSMSNTHRGLIWGKGGDGRKQEVSLLRNALPKPFKATHV